MLLELFTNNLLNVGPLQAVMFPKSYNEYECHCGAVWASDSLMAVSQSVPIGFKSNLGEAITEFYGKGDTVKGYCKKHCSCHEIDYSTEGLKCSFNCDEEDTNQEKVTIIKNRVLQWSGQDKSLVLIKPIGNAINGVGPEAKIGDGVYQSVVCISEKEENEYALYVKGRKGSQDWYLIQDDKPPCLSTIEPVDGKLYLYMKMEVEPKGL